MFSMLHAETLKMWEQLGDEANLYDQYNNWDQAYKVGVPACIGIDYFSFFPTQLIEFSIIT